MSIVKVWGKADLHNLIFTKTDPSSDKYWEVSVPPDMEDGMYATELWAENDIGKRGKWIGMLYITDSKVIWMYVSDPNYDTVVIEDKYFEYITSDCPSYLNSWIIDGRLEYCVKIRSNKGVQSIVATSTRINKTKPTF